MLFSHLRKVAGLSMICVLIAGAGMSVEAYSTYDFDNDGLSNSIEETFKTDIRSADTDKDGYLDGEEVYDLGTNPVLHTSSIFSDEERVKGDQYRLLSLQTGDSIAGDSVYLKGVADIRDSEILMKITPVADSEMQAVTKRFETDQRGVFGDMVDLTPLCSQAKGDLRLVFMVEESVLLDDVSLSCSSPDDLAELVSDVTLGGMSVTGSPLEIAEGANMSLGMALAPGYELRATFASMLFSSSFLADTATSMVSLSPIKPLEAGEHTVTYYVVDTKEKILYPPSRIYFTVLPSSLISLKAELPLAHWMLFPVVAMLLPVFAMLVRMMRERP